MSEEYQQIAALVCLDLDTLLEVSTDRDITLEELREQIKLTHSLKEEMIVDSDIREKRFNMAVMLFNLPKG